MDPQVITGTWIAQADVLSAFKAAQSQPTHTDSDLLTAVSKCCPTRAIVIGGDGTKAQVTVYIKDAHGNQSQQGPFIIEL